MFPVDGSWVVGNNWQLALLTADERRYLDTHPRVFVLNHFPSNWRAAGFRGTYHVFGDTKRAVDKSALRGELRAIVNDAEFLRRLSAVFVTEARQEHYIHHGPDCTTEWFLPFGHQLRRSFSRIAERLNTYRRGPARRREQRIARRWGDRVYHHASTITDAVNIAAIVYPGRPVRVVGNPFGVPYGYFYSDERRDQTEFLTNIWAGLRYLRDHGGIDVRDANVFHGAEIPAEFRLPRELIWGASR